MRLKSIKILFGLILTLFFLPVKATDKDSVKVKSRNLTELRNPSDLHSVILELNKNYNNVVEHCGTPGRPAFLCSGVIIRWTSMSEKYHNWDPSPGSIERGGVSFAYIRKDIKPGSTFHPTKKSGVIYYPSMLKPEGKGRAEVLCFFPIDGHTDGRIGKGGCGEFKNFPVVSRECQSQGITTADAWFTHYNSVTINKNPHQCGFNMSIGTPNSASIFNESIKAQRKIHPNNLISFVNEFIIATWETDSQGKIKEPEKLPIQAFFYTGDGLNEARYYQKDYFNTTGILVPIVGISLPITATDEFSFMFNNMEQNIVECTLE